MIRHQCLIGLWIASSTVSPAQEDPPKPVTAITAERSPVVSTLQLTGTVTARRQARLSARTDGLVRSLNVDAGDVVKAGDVLMELDDDLARLALERVGVERAQAELEQTEARRLADEVRELARGGAFSRSEAETRETSLKLRTTALEFATVEEREQQALVDRHQLPAPFDGVIGSKLAEEGEWVQTGTPVVELVELDGLRMDVRAPQELLARLKEGPQVSVRLDAYPEVVLKGEIGVMVPVKDAVSRTFLVRIELEDPEGLASPGMSGQAEFRFRSEKEALQIPRDAVVRFPDGSANVWVVDSDGLARSRQVTLGDGLNEWIEISSGLQAGSRVVLRGNEGLREGQAVEILPGEAGGNS